MLKPNRPDSSLWLTLVVLAACQSPAAPPASRTRPVPRPASVPGAPDAHGEGSAAGIAYVETMLGGAATTERVPMLVAIHGLGDEPRAFSQLFQGLGLRARLITPRGVSPYYGGFSWFPVNLQSHDPEHVQPGLGRAAESLARMLPALLRTRPTCGDAVVTGFSQGAMITYALVARHAEGLGAAFPISGMLPPSLYPTGYPGPWAGVHALHGENDGLVPLESARATVAALQHAGDAATLQTYPGVGHTVSAGMRRDLADALRAALAAQPCGG